MFHTATVRKGRVDQRPDPVDEPLGGYLVFESVGVRLGHVQKLVDRGVGNHLVRPGRCTAREKDLCLPGGDPTFVDCSGDSRPLPEPWGLFS